MIFVFVVGGICSTKLCSIFLGHAIWFALIPLGILLAVFLYADLKKEKGKLDLVPHGH
jgi:uncharacterized membrane protein YoaK (UPF0700 family)